MESVSEESPASSSRAPGSHVGVKLVGIGIGVAVVLGGTAAAFAVAQQTIYSAGAFVEDYVNLLADGRAADALAMPGVSVDSTSMEDARLSATASDALLRSDALASLTDVEVLEQRTDGDLTYVTVGYTAGAYPGSTTFTVEQAGTVGIAPTWRFAQSPLAVIDLTVTGSMRFQVNGFAIDKRQVAPEGMDADPAAPVSLLAFSPGLYSVAVDTAIAATPGIAVLSDSPMKQVPVAITASPTPEFTETVQERVGEFLDTCATQEVLQPTGCPFGYFVENRIDGVPTWSILTKPSISLTPAGAGWKITPTEAVAQIEVDIRSLRDGRVTHTVDEVPFRLTGDIAISPDGSASIVVTSPDTR